MNNKRLFFMAAVAVSALTSGCANQAKPLYQWGSYQPQVYEYFKAQNKGPEAQLTELEASLQKIKANGAVPPPGYYAHLGMLYASLGKGDQAVNAFQTEKSLFPESAQYMDFFLSKAKK